MPKPSGNATEEPPAGQSVDPRQRKRMQNRLAQRTYRERLKRRIEDLERWRDVALAVTGTAKDSDGDQFLMPPPISPPLTSDSCSSRETPLSGYQPDILADADQLSLAWTSPLDSGVAMNEFTVEQAEDASTAEKNPMGEDYGSLQPSQDASAPPSNSSRTQARELAAVTGDSSKEPFGFSLPTMAAPAIPPAPTASATGAAHRSSHGKTALHLAAERGQIAVVDVLLQRRLDPNLPDAEGRTALHLAVEYNHVGLVQMLTRTEGGSNYGVRAKINAQDHQGRSPLHIAVTAEYMSIIELLLCIPGINLEMKDCEGRTALHLAAVAGNGQITHALIAAGADIYQRVG